MRAHPVSVLLVAATGCNQVYGLEQTMLADGFVDALDLNDEDGDGLNNSLDNCPGITNGNQADADGDHVGDVCDINMTNPIDRIAATYFFNDPPNDAKRFASATGWEFRSGDAAKLNPVGPATLYAQLVPDGAGVVIEVGMSAADWQPMLSTSVGIVVEGAGGAQCWLEDNDRMYDETGLFAKVGTASPAGNRISPQLPDGAPIVFTAAYHRGTQSFACRVGSTGAFTGGAATPGPFAIFADHASATVRYIIVYTVSQ